MLCGGTQVTCLAEAARKVITKIKVDRGIIKVGYNLEVTSNKQIR